MTDIKRILWVISLLNPASAFVKACKMIYDVVIFFVERGSQIIDLVNAVIDSVSAIASGAIGGAAAMIEGALSQALPVVISFMASLLGLGGISNKIREVIDTIKAPIDEAIDWIIQQAINFARTIGNALGFGNSTESEDGEQTTEGEGLEDSEVGEVINFTAGHEGHHLWISTQGSSTEVMVASEDPKPVKQKLNDFQNQEDLQSGEGEEMSSLLNSARQQLDQTEQAVTETKVAMDRVEQNPSDEANEHFKNLDNKTEQEQHNLVGKLVLIFERQQEDEPEGALAACRGIHFQSTWDEEAYQQEVSKTAEDIIGKPEFSQATQEVARSLSGQTEPSLETLQYAVSVVEEELAKWELQEATTLSVPLEKINSDAKKKAYKQLANSGITEPSDTEFSEVYESIRQEMIEGRRQPITRGKEKKGQRVSLRTSFMLQSISTLTIKNSF